MKTYRSLVIRSKVARAILATCAALSFVASFIFAHDLSLYFNRSLFFMALVMVFAALYNKLDPYEKSRKKREIHDRANG